MQVKISQATRMIVAFIKAGLVPMLVGSPGCGKSQIVHKIAEEYSLKIIDLRLSQCDPTDLSGFPTTKGNKAGYLPMETFPIEGDKIPEGFNGWLLFLDEMNSAPPAVQAAAYKLILDKMVGIYKLHKNVAMVCAGNLETDNAIVQPMSTALQSRMCHLELVLDHKEWIDWSNDNALDHRLSSYIAFKPGNLFTFTPDHTDKTYACPRTWEFANRILKVTDDDSKDRLPMLAGTLSEGVAREFIGFCKIQDTLPTMHELMANPKTTPVSQEPSVLYALTGAIAHHANKDNCTELLQYVERMPIEFQVVCLRSIVRRNKPMLAHSAIRSWIASNATELF